MVERVECEPTLAWGNFIAVLHGCVLIAIFLAAIGIHRIADALDRAYPKPVAAEVRK